MGFPEGVLTAEEKVVLHLRPHAKVVVRPVLVLVAAAVALTVAVVMLPDNPGGRIGILTVGGVGLVLALARGAWPLLVWRCTHYVLTDERILLQDGVLARERRDLPLHRVNDHATSQGVLDRVLGCGTLTIDALGDRGPAVLVAVPGVQQVQTTLYELIEHDVDRHGGEDEESAESAESTVPAQAERAASRRQTRA